MISVSGYFDDVHRHVLYQENRHQWEDLGQVGG